MRLTDLETPALVLDRAKLEANAERMRAHLAALGGRLRPHVKTAKCIEAVRMALADCPGIELRVLPNHARAAGAQHAA